MATDFKYAAQTDLGMYYPNFSTYDAKRQIYGWEEGATDFADTDLDIYFSHNTGLVSTLYWDGAEVDKIAFNTTETTQVKVAISPSSTSIDVDDTGSFGQNDILKINGEYMRVSAVTYGDTLAVTGAATHRGLFNTNAQQHAVDSVVYKIIDKGADVGDATSSGQDALSFVYDTDLDMCLVITNSVNPNDYVVEGGYDNATYFDQMLVNASMELNNLLDRRYPTPIPKYTQYDADTTHVSSATEYDAIIIKSTCYLCVANLLRTNSRQEEADYYNNLVTNVDGSGLVDRLNKGEYKLSYEVDSDDSQGKPRTISKTGTMDIIETGGAYSGQAFDLLRITCTTAGAYGVAKVKVEYYGSDKLFGSETTDITVTGGLQHIHGGWYCRFQGASMNLSGTADQWEVEVYSETRKISNAEAGAVQLTRRGYGI